LTPSAVESLQIAVDHTAPLISGAGVSTATRIVVSFNEPVTTASAQATANYQLSGGASVSAASLSANGRTVLLVTSTLSPGSTYTLTVNNVRDLANNVIATDSRKDIAYTAPVNEIGLVGYWSFDENDSSVALDHSGNNNLGYVSKATPVAGSWAPGFLSRRATKVMLTWGPAGSTWM